SIMAIMSCCMDVSFVLVLCAICLLYRAAADYAPTCGRFPYFIDESAAKKVVYDSMVYVWVK
ncbi:MAG: hypothetical protein RSB16_05695, partial [Raoultibacter sp.]